MHANARLRQNWGVVVSGNVCWCCCMMLPACSEQEYLNEHWDVIMAATPGPIWFGGRHPLISPPSRPSLAPLLPAWLRDPKRAPASAAFSSSLYFASDSSSMLHCFNSRIPEGTSGWQFTLIILLSMTKWKFWDEKPKETVARRFWNNSFLFTKFHFSHSSLHLNNMNFPGVFYWYYLRWQVLLNVVFVLLLEQYNDFYKFFRVRWNRETVQ